MKRGKKIQPIFSTPKIDYILSFYVFDFYKALDDDERGRAAWWGGNTKNIFVFFFILLMINYNALKLDLEMNKS